MKTPNYSTMAVARLRANKRAYRSLVLGIFLSIFLIATLCLSVQGIYLSFLQQRHAKIGSIDMVVLDNDIMTDEKLRETGNFGSIGHAYLSGMLTDYSLYLGYYDEAGLATMELTPVEGRLPEQPGEVAIEATVRDVMDADWALGQTLELSVTPVDGEAEARSFTLVGILPERSEQLEKIDTGSIGSFPAILTYADEPAFATGRLAVHWVLELRSGVTLARALHDFVPTMFHDGLSGEIYGFSTTGEQTQFYGLGNALDVDRDMFSLIIMALVLGAALILSCGVGIGGAMDGVLSQRQEEIGILRALGATKRQIRRIYGRENLLLALIVSPASIAVSCLAVWGLSKALHGSIIFGFNVWLLLPIALFSVAVILLSGLSPLARASRLMPMSVIRDTAVLRRGKRIRAKQVFSPAKLISRRGLLLYPGRRLGAAVMVALMVLSCGILTILMSGYRSITVRDYPGFHIWNAGRLYGSGGNIACYQNLPLTRQSLNRLAGLPHVKRIRIDRRMPVHALIDHTTSYASTDGVLVDNIGMMDETQLREYNQLWAPYGRLGESQEHWEYLREKYLDLLKDYALSGEALATAISTLVLDEETLAMLGEYLTDGCIDVDAINAGREVIVLAPTIWAFNIGNGGYNFTTRQEKIEGDAIRLCENDCFRVGQELPLVQLYTKENVEAGATVYREDSTVRIGAVVDNLSDKYAYYNPTIFTTEQGLENMDLLVEGIEGVAVYMDGEISVEEEAELVRQITAIMRRAPGYTIFNQLENFREGEQKNRQLVLLLVSVATVFFAVAVSMVVSSITRQLQSEGRTIGMLRAVGADEKTILGCYGGQATFSVALGAAVGMGLLGTVYLINLSQGYIKDTLCGMGLTLGFMALLALFCHLTCRYLLRLRIRGIVRRSIIENIKEL